MLLLKQAAAAGLAARLPSAGCRRAAPSHQRRPAGRCTASKGSGGGRDGGGKLPGEYGDLEFDQSKGGDSLLQDTLVDMLGLQIGKKQVEEYADSEKEKLINAAEEIKDEVDRLTVERAAASDEAFDTAMESINQKADEFEEQLRANRERMEADKADYNAWQKRMAVQRSAGQFFKSLYTADTVDDGDGSSSTGGPPTSPRSQLLGEDRDALKARAAQVQDRVNVELGSARRSYLFGFLSLVLALVCLADGQSDSPSWPQIWLYSGLASVFGVVFLAERRFLREQERQRQQREGPPQQQQHGGKGAAGGAGTAKGDSGTGSSESSSNDDF